MNLPAFPTDSLYKWVSIFGLTIFIFNGYIFISTLWEHRENLAEHQNEIDFISTLTQFGAAFGIVLALWGFWQWYCKLQVHINREVKARADEQEYKSKIMERELDALEQKDT